MPVELPRPRRVADLDSAIVSAVAAEIRAHLVDTTDDAVAIETTDRRRWPLPLARDPRAGAQRRPTDLGRDRPAWFDPFRPDDEA